jgi:hypothetical protein
MQGAGKIEEAFLSILLVEGFRQVLAKGRVAEPLFVAGVCIRRR